MDCRCVGIGVEDHVHLMAMLLLGRSGLSRRWVAVMIKEGREELKYWKERLEKVG